MDRHVAAAFNANIPAARKKLRIGENPSADLRARCRMACAEVYDHRARCPCFAQHSMILLYISNRVAFRHKHGSGAHCA